MKIIDGLYIPEKHTIIPGRPLWPDIGRLPRLPRPDLPPFWELAIAQRAGAALAFASASAGNLTAFNCQTNDAVVVTVEIKTTTASVSSITDTIGNTYAVGQSLAINNGTSCRVEEWWANSIGANASNVITVNLAGGPVKFVVSAESYSGALSFGNTNTTTGSSTAPAITLTTQDTNNWIATGASAIGLPTLTATTPNVVRQTAVTSGGGSSTNVRGGEGDAGAFASAGSNTVTFTLGATGAWATAGLELRTVAPSERHQTRHIRMPVGFH